jgi:DNA invertase Pin-like site-specific DNA recombinase
MVFETHAKMPICPPETAKNNKEKPSMTARKPSKSAPLRAKSPQSGTAGYTKFSGTESTPKAGRKIGYVRVSTCEQNTDLQYDALKAAGCDLIFEDKVTGVSMTREGLDKALSVIGGGDKLYVWRLDRLGRSIPHVMTIVGALSDKGASLVSIGEGFDTGNEAGELYSTILAMIAHVERRMIASRTRAGLEAARLRGVRLGAKPKMSAHDAIEAKLRMRKGQKAEAVAHYYAVSRATLFRHMSTKPRAVKSRPNPDTQTVAH